MKQNYIYKIFFVVLALHTMCLNAQKQTKTIKENFNVADNAILNINTSNTDIEFETWNKYQVEIEVFIEIEGAEQKDMQAYFDQNQITIKGNSKQIDITTGVEKTWFFQHATGNNLSAEFAEEFYMPEITAIPDLDFLGFVIDSLQMPPVPPVPVPDFDYKAFEKDGDAYMKKWQKEFDKGFGKEYEKKMEAWQAKAEISQRAIEKQVEARMKVYEKRNEKQREAYEERREALEERNEKQREAYEDRREALMERKEELANRLHERADIIHLRTGGTAHEKKPNVYYYSSNKNRKGEKVKIKKYIRIKMPKSATLKMNVRHGEVKLAENTRNINATLSYSDLLASVIEGDKTEIDASYSPVRVQKWNYGKLKVNYSDNVSLEEVKNITLSCNSSEVTIDRVLESIFLENDFGAVTINTIDADFSNVDISMKNAELKCKLPKTPFTILVNGEFSKFCSPEVLKLNKTKNNNLVMYKGFNANKNSNKSIHITSKYSTVVLE